MSAQPPQEQRQGEHGTAAHNRDGHHIENTHNLSRACVEHPQLTWVILVGTVIWGVYGYFAMPQRKDPEIPIKQAMVVTPWPGATAEKVEELVTRQIEKAVASNSNVALIESTSRSNVSTVVFTLSDSLKTTGQVLDDIGGRLNAIQSLPQGAGPINYQRDFGDTATLLLTVASPKADDTEIALRAREVREAIVQTRPSGSAQRATLVYCVPRSTDMRLMHLAAVQYLNFLRVHSLANDPRIMEGPGYVAVDLETDRDDAAILGWLDRFIHERYRASELHPDAWKPVVIRDPATAQQRLASVAGEKYSYRELDDYTDIMEKALLATERHLREAPLVAKVDRSGILPEKIYLFYSQERLAGLGLKPENLPNVLSARNITLAGGQIDVNEKTVAINPSGDFHSEREIGDVTIGVSGSGAPMHLRDAVSIVRAYDSPANYLNFHTWKDAQGRWQRTRAISIAVQMGTGQQIGNFSKSVNQTLNDLRARLPQDLIIHRTSDQPRQVEENVELFMGSLYEAVILVVIVSFIGFWEWRSALLMAISIPLTLCMTFGLMHLLGIDLQQVSIASLIIALGLLVDDPVVAGDAIKRDLGVGLPRRIAAWLGPTKLATAILYATITNIVAYLPFLILPGSTGQFLYALPVVMGCSLVASRIVSMTFIPLLGYYILRPHPEPSVEERRTKGFAAFYYRLGGWAIEHRWVVLFLSFGVLGIGGWAGKSLKQQFFPKDLSYLAYVEMSLPADAPLAAADEEMKRIEQAILDEGAQSKVSVDSLTTYIGGGSPRFWYSLAPEPRHPNYGMTVLLMKDKHETTDFLVRLQRRMDRTVPGARVDARQLETGDAVGLPVGIRIVGEDIPTLRQTADRVTEILKSSPKATRVRDDWGEDRFYVDLAIDPERANLTGITNLDVAAASATAMSGYPLTVLREGDKQIPVVARLRMEERAQLDDIKNLYVYSRTGTQKVPLRQVSKIAYGLRNEVIRRRNQFRTITIYAAPQQGVLASEVMRDVRPKLDEVAKSLPPGYRLEVGGEEEKQKQGFGNLVTVLLISVACIFMALAFQFKSAVKPLIVFAAVPYGAVGALLSLLIMGQPFGFMGFLGVISLVGVIVSHIIVLFDFVEEKHAEGEPFKMAVLDAGIMRLRPVMITVGATVIALFPLALHGGPLWEPLCYAQIGGLTAATFITLLLVPVIYSICVFDLKVVRWEIPEKAKPEAPDASE